MDVTPPIADGAPETLIVDFEGDDTRIQLNEAQKTVWTKDDQVSVFYRSNANQLWKYTGETGERTAVLKCVDAGNATESMKRVVVVYPYNDNYYINTETYNVQASLPATQHYLADSYGLDGNIMISSAEYNQVTLKNVCGWLKLQLTGEGEVVNSITFKDNNGEQVAGELYINSADATSVLASDMGNIAEDEGENVTGSAGANLSFDDVALTEVTLDCGEGVTLGSEATAFYIALPPQTFEKGFKVEILCADDTKMVKSSSNSLSIERNHIQPMAEFSYTANISPSNQIWYTSSDGNIVTPRYTDVFGANITSNTYSNGKGVITFNGDVTSIGDYAFYYCDSLTSVNIPDSVTTIGDYAFYKCTSLTSVNIPDSVTTIGDMAFYKCTSLTSVNIGDSVTTIEGRAFRECTNLTSVNIPDSVTSIGDAAFNSCKSLIEFKGKYATEDGRSLIVDNTIIAYANASGTTYTIPDSVTSIGDYAFYECSSLTSVTIGDSVTKIGNYTFEVCSSLTSVTIGNGVTTIGEGAFCDCSSLTSVYISNISAWYNISFISSCANPLSNGCNLYLNNELVTDLTIPDSVTTIVERAFEGCSSLTRVTIPDSVTTIGAWAFDGCSSLTSVYCKATTPPDGGIYMFYKNASGRKIYVPAKSVSAYKIAEVWSDYADYIVGYDFEKGEVVPSEPKPADNEIWYTTTDGEMAELAYAVTNNINPAPTQSYRDDIGCYVVTFSEECYGSSGLTNPCGFSLFDDNSKNKIKTLQFSNGDRLFDNFVNDVGAWKASEMTSLEEINIPDNVTYIKERLFSYLFDLKRVIIGSNVTSIEAGAFEGCWGITSITLPENLESIGSLALWDTGITELIIPDKVQTLYTGNVPSSVVSLTIGYSVTNLKEDVWTTRDLSVVYCKPTTPPDNLKFLFYEIDRDMTVYVPTNSVDAYRTILDQYDRVTVKEYDF